MAKRFNFRLEPILRLRTHIVNQAKEELTHVVNQRTAKEMQIEEREKYFENIIKSGIKSTSASELQALYSHQDFVRSEIEKLEDEKSQLLEIEDYKRGKLTEAMKKEKILEKLKEKKKIIYNEEISKEETKTLDEIASKEHHQKDKSI
jgi:flagellar export protein FliJ